LADSNEQFALHLLMGKPRESKLQTAYVQAQNILHKMPVKHEFVQEDEAEQFAESLTNEIKEHGG
jgi:type IV secretory pathway VirD2 relaxase